VPISGHSTMGLSLTPLQEQNKMIWSKEPFVWPNAPFFI
jgi:hypothetical protein